MPWLGASQDGDAWLLLDGLAWAWATGMEACRGVSIVGVSGHVFSICRSFTGTPRIIFFSCDDDSTDLGFPRRGGPDAGVPTWRGSTEQVFLGVPLRSWPLSWRSPW